MKSKPLTKDLSSIPLKQAVTELAERAAKVMQKAGYHVPLVICEGKQPFVAQPDFTNPVTKEQSMRAIAKKARKSRASRVFLITEAWGLASPESLDVRPSQHPRREEILMVTGKDAGGQLVMAHMPIVRREDKVMVGPVNILETGGKAQAEAYVLRHFFTEPAKL